MKQLSRNVFPALAGVILIDEDFDTDKLSFSRTRGGDPRTFECERRAIPFFPHSRG